MHERFIRRIEQGIERLQKTCEQKSGKDITKTIERRIGRLVEKNSRGAAFFTLTSAVARLLSSMTNSIRCVPGPRSRSTLSGTSR